MIIQLATSLVFLASSIYGQPAQASVAFSATINEPAQAITLEQYVKEYYKENPILAEIARCESTFRHFGRNGEVIRGIENKSDVGIMQINEYYHNDQAKRLGYDIKDLEGNMAYAQWLFDKEGVRPWNASSKCWKAFHTENSEMALAK
jgi:hypothetical protein